MTTGQDYFADKLAEKPKLKTMTELERIETTLNEQTYFLFENVALLQKKLYSLHYPNCSGEGSEDEGVRKSPETVVERLQDALYSLQTHNRRFKDLLDHFETIV